MSEQERFSRRKFLRRLSSGLALTTVGCLASVVASKTTWAQAKAPETASKTYTLAPWTGDDFTLGHQLRNHEIPEFPKNVERTVDFVIIGGGIAGLASAYNLRHHNFLLLEQYDTLGGQSRGSSYQGIGYSYGAAYMTDMRNGVGDFLASLSLKPIELSPQKNAWHWENKWSKGVEGAAGNKLYSEFKHFLADCKPMWKQLDRVVNPVPLKDADLAKLDSVVFSSVLKGYSPAFMALIDAFLRSSNCAGVDGLSALAAIESLEELTGPSYVFPGGNPTLAKALIDQIKGPRCAQGFVWSVEVADGKSTVVYTGKDGHLHKVACKHVIIAAPPLVAARIMKGIPDATKSLLLSCKYGSYLVANLLMKRRRFIGSYDNWVAPPFTFADITIAETPYMENKTYKEQMGSVLTIYQPYPPSSAGRPLLLGGDREKFADSILSQMSQLVGNIEKDVESVVLSRWGHAMAITSPGFFAKISKLNDTTASGYTFAHCSTQGLACAESAIIAARLAANRALGKHSGRS